MVELLGRYDWDRVLLVRYNDPDLPKIISLGVDYYGVERVVLHPTGLDEA